MRKPVLYICQKTRRGLGILKVYLSKMLYIGYFSTIMRLKWLDQYKMINCFY